MVKMCEYTFNETGLYISCLRAKCSLWLPHEHVCVKEHTISKRIEELRDDISDRCWDIYLQNRGLKHRLDRIEEQVKKLDRVDRLIKKLGEMCSREYAYLAFINHHGQSDGLCTMTVQLWSGRPGTVRQVTTNHQTREEAFSELEFYGGNPNVIIINVPDKRLDKQN